MVDTITAWLLRLWCRIVGHSAMSRLVFGGEPVIADMDGEGIGPGWQTWCQRCGRELPA